MNLEHSWLAGRAKRRFRNGFRRRWFSLLSILVTFPLVSGYSVSAQLPLKKDVLILSDVGLSHALTANITRQIVAGVQETPGRHVEFYSESFDLLSLPGSPSSEEARDWLAKKYGGHKLDVVVAVGPTSVDFLSKYSQTLFSDVPVVVCGTSSGQLGNPRLDSRFTGTLLKLEPEKTLEVALRLFPDTRHVFVVGGSSAFDKVVISLTKVALSSFSTKAEIIYLTDMEMGKLLQRLQNLPSNSLVLYTSFLQDSVGNGFLNATKALPMIAAASNGPDFGMSDTYLGNGIVGGHVMTFEEQGKITARIISELLDGKKPQELPIETLPSVYMFDWHQLEQWHIPESRLPAGSIILFREATLWERTKWIWTAGFLIILALSVLAGYLLYAGKQLKLAKDRERQLSGMLINAEEHERQRIASELHDDFSQRLAVLALRLENVDEVTPASLPDVHKQLRELVKSTGELGADIHTLSHRLHSSTLESLGLVPAVAAMCNEFIALQGIRVCFTSNEIPRSIHPDIAICVFRIVQEGLWNLKKHSGAEDAEVVLRMTGDRLEVVVRDKGSGFDLEELRQNEGLGVRSMEERARLLGGKFEILSEIGMGTTIKAWVPLKPDTRLVKR